MENFEDYTIEVKWEVDDGYAGKSRPQKTIIKPYDDMDFEDWNEMTEEEKEGFEL